MEWKKSADFRGECLLENRVEVESVFVDMTNFWVIQENLKFDDFFKQTMLINEGLESSILGRSVRPSAETIEWDVFSLQESVQVACEDESDSFMDLLELLLPG